MIRHAQHAAVGLALVAASLLATPAPAGAAAAGNSLGAVNVACVTDASANDLFEVTVGFTHRGPAELRIYGLLSGQLVDSDHGWFRGSGADTFVGHISAPTPRSVEVHLLHVDHRTSSLVDSVTPVVVGPFDCQA